MSMDTSLPESDPAPPTEVRLDASTAALLSRAVGALVGRSAILIVSFGFAVIVARILDPAGRGDFALLQATNGLTIVLANFAIGGAVVYHLGKGRLSPQRTVGAASILAVLSGAAAALILIPLGLAFRSRIFPGIAPLLIVAAILLATPLLLREYVGGTLIALGRPQRYVLSHAIQPLAAILTLAPLLIFASGTIETVTIGWTIGITLSGLTALLLTTALIRSRPQLVREDLFILGRFGVRTYPALLTRFLNLRLDQFLVRLLASSAVLGQYAVAVNVGELLIQIPVVMLWALSGAISAADPGRSGELVAQFCRLTLILLLVAAISVAIATPFAVPLLFGSSYRGAVSSVLLLLPGMVCYAPATIIAEFFIVQRGNPGKAALIAGTSVVMSSLLNFVLTPALGAAGASLASSISYALMLLTASLLFRRETGISHRHLLRASGEDLQVGLRSIREIASRRRLRERRAE